MNVFFCEAEPGNFLHLYLICFDAFKYEVVYLYPLICHCPLLLLVILDLFRN